MTGSAGELDNVVVHQSEILSQFPEIVHGMSTIHGGSSPDPFGLNCSFSVGDEPLNVQENRRRFFAALGILPESIAFTRQVHGDHIVHVRNPGTYDSCDGLIADHRGTGVSVSVGDCLPVLLYDPVTVTIGAIHAGWRGSRNRILAGAVKMFRERFGVKPENIFAWIGPSAGVCCYEVGEEVASVFAPDYLKKLPGHRPHLDLKSFNRDVLLESGLDSSGIEVAPECTICSPGMFHSYRREGARSGRMLAVIGLRTSSPSHSH
jgi:polyphenol oxidase